MNKKICEMVTNRLIEELEKGIIPWERPWHGGEGAISHSTGKPYSLLNQFILARNGEYITYNQCKAEGGKVKKGAKGMPVVFWKQIVVEDTDPATGEKKQKRIPMLRYYTVFHIDDCEGISAKYATDAAPRIHANPDAEAEAIVTDYANRERMTINRTEASNRAFYSPTFDYVTVPTIEQFDATAEYYSTLFHEITHSTGHSSRLARFEGNAKNAAFGSTEYSKEELVAEIGAASLVNHCGLETRSSFRNSAAYIQSWLEALRNDPTMIVAAAGKAEKAINYILNIEPAKG